MAISATIKAVVKPTSEHRNIATSGSDQCFVDVQYGGAHHHRAPPAGTRTLTPRNGYAHQHPAGDGSAWNARKPSHSMNTGSSQ